MAQDRCIKCGSENIYQDQNLWICPDCAHEWLEGESSSIQAQNEQNSDPTVRDANGNELVTGDSVVVVKDLKIKGASSTIKGGTKVRNIRVIDADDGHNIFCKIDGIGSIHLKSEFVKKV